MSKDKLKEAGLSYWHPFSEKMLLKALKHLEKYPDDLLKAWEDKRYDINFWVKRLKEENYEFHKEIYLSRKQEEALDIANICLFIWYNIESMKSATEAKQAT